MGFSASAAGVVVAGGSGTRLGSERNKAYLPLAGRSLASWGLLALGEVAGVDVLVLVIRRQDRDEAERLVAHEAGGLPVELVEGGATRHQSERNALRHLAGRIGSGNVDAVLVHDAARPLAGAELAAAVLRAARSYGGAVPALPADDIVTVQDPPGGASGFAECALPEAGTSFVRAQTPQGFRARPLLRAFEAAAAEGFAGTDTASCLIRYSDERLRWVAGESRNIKITHPQDIVLARRLVDARSPGRTA